LRPGIYFHLPFVDSVVLEYNQEKVINLDNITVPTMDKDSKVVILSCNIRYRMADFYKAYTVVHDFEKSLKDYTLAILAQNSRGKTYDDWKNPKIIERLQDKVLMELREVVTEKWGLEIYKVYVTDNVSCIVQRVLHEGPPLVVNNSPTPNSQEREAA
jgi:regulator of protease activity HflC (stomatin/prohibitin superfamily)